MRFLIITALLLCSHGSLADKTNKIVIAGDNWCPINCGANDTNKCYMIDVATEALALSGYTLVYEEIPWTRAVGLARKGEINGVVGAFKGDAPDFHFPQFALLKISPSNLFVKAQKDWRFQSIRSLNKVVLGSIKGYDYGDTLNNYIQSVAATDDSSIIQIYGNDAVKRSIEFLMKDRIDVFVETGPVFWYQAKQMGLTDKVKDAGSVSDPEPCFIAFSPALEMSQVLTLELDKGIILLKQKKRLQVIAAKYGLPVSVLF